MPLHNSLYSLRFEELAQYEGQLSDDDAYAVIRANLVLGNYEVARKEITNHSQQSKFSKHSELLELQLEGFTSPASKSRVERLENWLALESPTLSSFLLGEARFTLGYLRGAVSRYKAALREFSTAIRYYEHAQLSGHAGIARFNYILCAHHLGLETERNAELDRFSGDAERFFEQTRNPVLLAFAERFRGYRAIERGELSEAASALHSARTRFLTLKRMRDAGEMLSFEMVVALKSQRMNQFYLLADKLRDLSIESPLLRQRAEFLEKIAELALPNAQDALALVRAAKEKGLDGVTMIIIGELLLCALLQAGAYEDVIITHRGISKLPRGHEQAPWLIDYRPHLAEALKHVGREADSGAVLHTMRVQQNRSSLCEINLRANVVTHHGHKKSIQEHPLVAKMLERLHSAPDGLAYEVLFELIYEHAFDPIRHQSRYHSLIARTRRFLPPGLLEWNNGRLRFNPNQPVHLTSCPPLTDRPRRTRPKGLLGMIGRKKSFTLEELSQTLLRSGSSLSRRTLQYDLKKLIRDGTIVRIGRGPSTRYERCPS